MVGLLLLFLLFPLLLLFVCCVYLAHRINRTDEQLQHTSNRVDALRKAIEELKAQFKAFSTPAPTVDTAREHAVSVSSAATAAEPQVVRASPSVGPPEVLEAICERPAPRMQEITPESQAEPIVATVAAPPVPEKTIHEAIPPMVLPQQPEAAFVAASVAVPSGPAPQPALPQPPAASPATRPVAAAGPKLFDLEETLGTNWLLKIGVTILVIGISLFLAYSVQKLGPWGKVTVGLGVSAVAIAVGWFIERREKWTVFGRVVLSGGWGLAYFTAYAMRNVEAARVLERDAAGLIVMLTVAAGIVGHSLKYRSQFVTGFAYGLAYLTLTINHVEWQTLVAGAVLATSMVAILRWLDWYGLEIFAIVGAYGTHLLWLSQRINPFAGQKTPFPEYTQSTALLIFIWVIFTISHYLRRGKTETQERLLQFSLLLNTIGYIGVSSYQSVHPELAFSFFAIVGIVYFGLAYLSRRLNRHRSHLLTWTIAAVLVVLAIPYKFSGNNLGLVWLAEAEMFLIAGFRLRELWFRRLGFLASALVGAYFYGYWIEPVLTATASRTAGQGIVLLVVGLTFASNKLLLQRRYHEHVQTGGEKVIFTIYLYAGWLTAIVASWFLVPDRWLILTWLLGGAGLYELSRKVKELHLHRTAHLTIILAIGRGLLVHFPNLLEKDGWNREATILAAFAVMLFLFSENFRRKLVWEKNELDPDQTRTFFDSYCVVAWALLIATSWHAFASNDWLVLLWFAFAVLLYESSRQLSERRLQYLSHLTIAVVLFRLLNFNTPILVKERAWSLNAAILVAAAFLLFLFSENFRRKPLRAWSKERVLFDVYCYTGWVLVLVWSWLVLPWVWWGVALMVFAWVLHLVGVALAEKRLKIQAQITALMLAVRVVAVNLPNAETWFGCQQRVLIGGPVAILLYGYGELARKHPPIENREDKRQHWLNAPAATVILALLAWYSLSANGVALAWGLLALILLEIGRALERPDFRAQGHIMAAMTFARVMLANINATGRFGVISIRMLTVIPLVVFFYYVFEVLGHDEMSGPRANRFIGGSPVRKMYSYFGLISLLATLRFEVSEPWVAAAWSVVAMGLVALARHPGFESFRPQAIFLTFVILALSVFENFELTGRLWNLSLRAVTTGATVVFLFLAFLFARALPSIAETTEVKNIGLLRRVFRACVRKAFHFLFFASVGLVTALVWLENSHGGYLTTGWAIEALVVFVLAVVVNERAYRLFGLILLLVCTAKIVVLDVWMLESLQRIVTFIVLGAVLVMVSFFYTRYRESWRKLFLGS